MKRILCIFITLLLLVSPSVAVCAGDPGEGNLDGGGGGMGSGTSSNYWSNGDEGVRVTVVRASDRTIVTTPVDFTNKRPNNISINFGKICKISYINGQGLTPNTNLYVYKNTDIAIPQIITSDSGNANIEAIKRYFCSEYAVMMIAENVGMNYEILINGDYKLLLEPVAYLTYGGVKYAMTATEAALYDKQLGGGIRRKFVDFSHKNLPLSMFLEIADLGFPAWHGSYNARVSNDNIISSLGLGIVRFRDNIEPPPEISAYDYEYRVNTDVITAVTISGGRSDPDRPVSVKFNIKGTNYSAGNVYYPSGDSQLAWVRWRTPSTPQTFVINVTVTGGGSSSSRTINVKIIDLDRNPPPNPVADDRNDSFTPASIPSKAQKTSASWGVWRPWWYSYWVWHSRSGGGGYWCDHGWWEFDYDRYSASLSAAMAIAPDEKNPTASGRVMKSGYGINQTVVTGVTTNQSSAVTDPQNAVTYFPEFRYDTYWRLLERVYGGYSSQFEFKRNEYSTYNRRTHFTPIWMPDGAYKPYTWLIDCWTPVGMLSMNLSDTLMISGNLWMDWHISQQKPD